MKEFRDLMAKDIDDANVYLIGIPFDKNASVGKGASEAPRVLRELSYELPAFDAKGQDLREKIKIYDFGDILTEDFNKMEEEITNKLYSKEGLHLIFGGDHSIAIASERAFFNRCKKLNKTPVIIHIDAHPDICDEYEGNKYSHACPIYRALEYGYEDKNITLIGVRGFEAQEVETFKKHPLLDVFKANDVKMMGIELLIKILKTKYSDDKYLIYISYDIDANDPCYAPGTGTPESFGLSNFETMTLIQGIITNLNVDTLDIVEVAPPLDVNNITSWLAVKSLYEFFTAYIQKTAQNLDIL